MRSTDSSILTLLDEAAAEVESRSLAAEGWRALSDLAARYERDLRIGKLERNAFGQMAKRFLDRAAQCEADADQADRDAKAWGRLTVGMRQ